MRTHLNLNHGEFADNIEIAKIERTLRVTYREYSALGNMKLIAVQKAVLNTIVTYIRMSAANNPIERQTATAINHRMTHDFKLCFSPDSSRFKIITSIEDQMSSLDQPEDIEGNDAYDLIPPSTMDFADIIKHSEMGQSKVMEEKFLHDVDLNSRGFRAKRNTNWYYTQRYAVGPPYSQGAVILIPSS